MTIHRDEGHWVVECDTCGDLHPAEFETKSEAIQFVQRGPWVAFPDGEGGWEHQGPCCIPSAGKRLAHAQAMFSKGQSKP